MAFARRGWLVIVIAVALAAAFARQQFGTHNTPPGQPDLAHISGESIDALRTDFNKAADAIRLVVLLSPT
jgi:hypothetical protein